MKPVRYPLQPLFDVTGWSLNEIRKMAPCNGEEYRLRADQGVTEATADRLAVAAGYHPFSIWPEMADTAIADAGRQCANDLCADMFTPTRSTQIYCSPTCRHRTASRRWEAQRYATDADHAERKRERARELRRAASPAWRRADAARKRRASQLDQREAVA